MPASPAFHLYPTLSFHSLDVYDPLSYAWWWCGRDLCVSLHDHQVRPCLRIHLGATRVQPTLGVALVTPIPSTHGFHFRAHRRIILDRNTGVSARFVCLGVHAIIVVSSSNMWCCLIILLIWEIYIFPPNFVPTSSLPLNKNSARLCPSFIKCAYRNALPYILRPVKGLWPLDFSIRTLNGERPLTGWKMYKRAFL